MSEMIADAMKKMIAEEKVKLDEALGRIKSLETKSSELEKQVAELKGANQVLKESKDELKESNVGQSTSAQLWADMAKDVSGNQNENFKIVK